MTNDSYQTEEECDDIIHNNIINSYLRNICRVIFVIEATPELKACNLLGHTDHKHLINTLEKTGSTKFYKNNKIVAIIETISSCSPIIADIYVTNDINKKWQEITNEYDGSYFPTFLVGCGYTSNEILNTMGKFANAIFTKYRYPTIVIGDVGEQSPILDYPSSTILVTPSVYINNIFNHKIILSPASIITLFHVKKPSSYVNIIGTEKQYTDLEVECFRDSHINSIYKTPGLGYIINKIINYDGKLYCTHTPIIRYISSLLEDYIK